MPNESHTIRREFEYTGLGAMVNAFFVRPFYFLERESRPASISIHCLGGLKRHLPCSNNEYSVSGAIKGRHIVAGHQKLIAWALEHHQAFGTVGMAEGTEGEMQVGGEPTHCRFEIVVDGDISTVPKETIYLSD